MNTLLLKMILDLFLGLIAQHKNISQYKLTPLKRIVIGGIIAPHGITDIFHKNFSDIVLYHVYLIICCLIDYMLPLKYNLSILTILSIRHISDDIGYFGSIILHFISIFALDVNLGFDVFFIYMTFIHVPIHYYKNLKTKQDFLITLAFSLILLFGSLNEKIFLFFANILPINGIIWNHIIFSL